MFAVLVLPAQEVPSDKVSVAFSDPGRPGLLKVGIITGSITVKGYEGKEVVVEAHARRPRRPDRSSDAAEGLRRIQIGTTGLSVTEQNNVMDVDVGSHHRAIDLTLQVPVQTSLKLATVNDGDIVVERVRGEIELDNKNGAITATGITGSVVAHALNGNIRVSFDEITPDKSMSFSSLNGNIDVTFPATLKARVTMRTDNGEIYSDFDIALDQGSRKPVVEDARGKGGRYRVRIDRSTYGTINGGGPEFQFKNFNGNIYIRKAKV
jgi:DUF4097 and DUF4098 domain-containing protein YvlB